MLGFKYITSCNPYVKEQGSLYYLSLVLLVQKNMYLFETNSNLYSSEMTIVTKNRNELRIPPNNAKLFHKKFQALKAFQMLPNDCGRVFVAMLILTFYS